MNATRRKVYVTLVAEDGSSDVFAVLPAPETFAVVNFAKKVLETWVFEGHLSETSAIRMDNQPEAEMDMADIRDVGGQQLRDLLVEWLAAAPEWQS